MELDVSPVEVESEDPTKSGSAPEAPSRCFGFERFMQARCDGACYCNGRGPLIARSCEAGSFTGTSPGKHGRLGSGSKLQFRARVARGRLPVEVL